MALTFPVLAQSPQFRHVCLISHFSDGQLFADPMNCSLPVQLELSINQIIAFFVTMTFHLAQRKGLSSQSVLVTLVLIFWHLREELRGVREKRHPVILPFQSALGQSIHWRGGSLSVVFHSLRPQGCTRFLCPWDFPGKNTGVGCHFLLQGVFPSPAPYKGQLLLHYKH